MAATISSPGLSAPVHKTTAFNRSALRDMMTMVMRPNILSLALGLPDLELLPLADCRAAAARVFAGDRAVLRWRYGWAGDDGTPGHVRGVDVLRLRDGKVAEKLSYVKG